MDATLAILGGGKGKRLGGAPKGLITLHGRTILELQLVLLPAFTEALFVATDPSPYATLLAAHPEVRVVPDLIPDKGAPGGVHAALAAARSEWVVTLACDMPFVTPKVIQLLLSERAPDVDVVAFQAGGRLHPLLAAYRASLHAAWGRALATDPPLRLLIGKFRARLLPEDRLQRVDPKLRSLEGINQPADLARLGASLPPVASSPGPRGFRR
ncbi:MAG TPA: molybdenum cofactor guanylyltransferase [Myxococcaceae bacterium]|nr:molybdenum cofactor guanylyltransferase [Myxococcaceae bacterium]